MGDTGSTEETTVVDRQAIARAADEFDAYQKQITTCYADFTAQVKSLKAGWEGDVGDHFIEYVTKTIETLKSHEAGGDWWGGNATALRNFLEGYDAAIKTANATSEAIVMPEWPSEF